MGRIIRYTFAGALGSIIAWAVMEPTWLMPDVEKNIGYAGVFLTGLIAGAVIGLFFGIAEGRTLSTRDAIKCAMIGTLVGAAGGVLGLTFGDAVYGAMKSLAGVDAFSSLPSNLPAEAVTTTPKFVSFILLLIGRGFGWSLFGMFIGLSQGVATGSTKKMINGALGGFIGGGIGGMAFEIFKWMNKGGLSNFPPAMIRFICFSITGAAIGLFIGCIEEFAKQAWLVRLVGRNEGRSYDLYKAQTVIGRNEMADISIFTDPDISERHAIITLEGKSYAIQDLGSAFGTSVNGAKITKDYLRDGDVIVAGKTKLVFRDKATAASSSYAANANNAVQIPNSMHVCQFCGSVKDVSGNCDCSVNAPEPSINSPVQRPTANQTVQQSAMPGPTMGPFGGADLTSGSSAGVGMGARLAGLTGPYAGNVFVLKAGETQIGRDASKDIGLPLDTTVSRDHARISLEGASYVIYDSGSTNGTYIGAAKIQRKELVPSDIVQIGNTKFRFEV